MRPALLEILVDPVTRSPLALYPGELRSPEGARYPVRDGIPRFVAEPEPGQAQVTESFAYKWSVRGGYEDPRVNANIERDEPPRFGMRTIDEFRAIFRGSRRMLDAGCGSAHFASIYVRPDSRPREWVGLDISSAIDIAKERLGGIEGTSFVQGDLHALPFADASFDRILSRGAMHHTPSTERAFRSLARALEPGGEFVFLVYRKNGPVREFTDDHIRAALSTLPPEEAWEALRSLTRFGEALSKVDATVDVPEDIPYLGVPAGRYTVHQLVYDHFVKAFSRPGWSEDESVHVSFDWYHPAYAFRHTEQEVREWCADAGLRVTHCDARWTSLAVRAVKERGSAAPR